MAPGHNPLPAFAWLTPRWIDGVDRRRSFEFTHSRLKNNLPNADRVWAAEEAEWRKTGGLKQGGGGVKGLYWNERKLVQAMKGRGEGYGQVGGVGGEEGGVRGARKAVAGGVERKGARARGRVVVQQAASAEEVSEGMKREVQVLHENEGKMLDAWKAELALRKQRTRP